MDSIGKVFSNQEQKKITSKNLPELVFIKDNTPKTTSLKVAEYFEKRHDHVVRDIAKILETIKDSNVPKNGAVSLVTTNPTLMFTESNYFDAKNESRKMYEMDRDGFTLLAMGFTGSKALKFKLDYIAAFNAMEQKLKGEAILQQPQLPPPKPIEDSRHLVSFYHPSVTMMIKKTNIKDSDYWRWVDFDASLMFTVQPDNTIKMSESQFNKALEMIGWELKSTLSNGFNSPSGKKELTIAEEVIEPPAPALPAPDKFAQLESTQELLQIRLAAATSQIEELKAIKEKEEALRTKAQIGDRKVASALGRVGALTKKAKKLEHENKHLKKMLQDKTLFDKK